jgi:hypothetical protein
MADGSVNTSVLPSGAYLPLAGGTLTGALSGTSASFSSTVTATTGTTGAAIKLTGFTNYGVIEDANAVRRIWFENTGSYRTIFDLPASGNAFQFRTSAGTVLLDLTSTGAATFSSTLQTNGNAFILPTLTGGGAGGGLYLGVFPDTQYTKQAILVERYVGGLGNYGRGSLHFCNRDTADANQPTLADSRMVITSGGDLYANQSTFFGNPAGDPASPNTHTFYSSGYFQSSYLMYLRNGATSPTYTYMADWHFSNSSGRWSSGTGQQFLRCRDDQNRLIIYESGNVQNYNNSYGSLSDIKVKENITDASPKLNDLLKVRIVNYNKIGDKTKQIGVIAQELEQIFPSMIEEIQDTIDVEVEKTDENGITLLDNNGNPILENKIEVLETTTKSVKYSVFVPMLIKSIQELEARVKELEAK